MQWASPSEKDTLTDTLKQKLWAAADQLHANFGRTALEFSHQLTLRLAQLTLMDQAPHTKIVSFIRAVGKKAEGLRDELLKGKA